MSKQPFYYIYVLAMVAMTAYVSFIIIKYSPSPAISDGLTGRFFDTIGIYQNRGDYVKKFRNEGNVDGKKNLETLFKNIYGNENISALSRIENITIPTEKKNKIRIICLGDSFTMGYGVDKSDTWPSQLENKLNSGNEKYEVMNLGISGIGSAEELTILKSMIEYNPDIVILQFHSNDFINISEAYESVEELKNEYEKGNLEIRIDEKEKNEFGMTKNEYINYYINKMAWGIKYKTYTKEEEWNKTEPHLIKMIEITEKNNIEFIIFAFDIYNYQSTNITRLSDEYDFTFLNMKEYIHSLPLTDIRLQDYHFNPNGYDIISDELLKTLEASNN